MARKAGPDAIVTRVKTMVVSEAELDRLHAWAQSLPHVIDVHKPGVHFASYAELGYYKHLHHPSRWRVRKAIEQGLGAAIRLGDKRLERFARCAVLRTAQWALDGRKKLPSIREFGEFLERTALEMLEGADELRSATRANGHRPMIEIINRSAAGIEEDERLLAWKPPSLVLTSPPYPGVHVLYHRWQVDGRKETPLPFMIHLLFSLLLETEQVEVSL
jgi:hypothetical protein